VIKETLGWVLEGFWEAENHIFSFSWLHFLVLITPPKKRNDRKFQIAENRIFSFSWLHFLVSISPPKKRQKISNGRTSHFLDFVAALFGFDFPCTKKQRQKKT
tara:strand:- start:357 stop:665 length:309 start_codon:yes stop_codon:yes gene_type:complete